MRLTAARFEREPCQADSRSLNAGSLSDAVTHRRLSDPPTEGRKAGQIQRSVQREPVRIAGADQVHHLLIYALALLAQLSRGTPYRRCVRTLGVFAGSAPAPPAWGLLKQLCCDDDSPCDR